ncbi:hypothetical protein [Kitasatospora cineracea]|uniref:Uncharacterized protein n=1 Tax=Kitasatospora cineracea TaxID=88074 RepID=A0A8G1XGL1_9ACTN|nr:hypothetical protein [Kitasatospora cineracea]ROR46507.1 hypothetical protein EDD39_4782 [Kitasatospora cineracea]
MTQHHPGTRPEMPDTGTIFSWISDLATFSGRGTQTLDDRRSADYLVDAFTRFGLSDIQVQEADSLHWHATRSELTVAGTPVPHAPAAFSHDTGIGPFHSFGKADAIDHTTTPAARPTSDLHPYRRPPSLAALQHTPGTAPNSTIPENLPPSGRTNGAPHPPPQGQEAPSL